VIVYPGFFEPWAAISERLGVKQSTDGFYDALAGERVSR